MNLASLTPEQGTPYMSSASKKFGQKMFLSKNFEVQKIYLGQKNFGFKNIFQPKKNL